MLLLLCWKHLQKINILVTYLEFANNHWVLGSSELSEVHGLVAEAPCWFVLAHLSRQSFRTPEEEPWEIFDTIAEWLGSGDILIIIFEWEDTVWKLYIEFTVYK